jgi:uncharacterized protein DUF4154
VSGRPSRAYSAVLSGLLALALTLYAPQPAQAGDSLATAVKAAYLYKFAPFVQWPPGAAAGAPFTVCVIGDDPFGSVLDRAVSGQKVEDRPIVVRRLAAATHDSPCQIAFLGGSKGQSVRDALSVLHAAPVLTVTDGGGAPGVIDFAQVQGRIRFRVDDQTAAEDGLRISSKLLSLAVTVRPRKLPVSNP